MLASLLGRLGYGIRQRAQVGRDCSVLDLPAAALSPETGVTAHLCKTYAVAPLAVVARLDPEHLHRLLQSFKSTSPSVSTSNTPQPTGYGTPGPLMHHSIAELSTTEKAVPLFVPVFVSTSLPVVYVSKAHRVEPPSGNGMIGVVVPRLVAAASPIQSPHPPVDCGPIMHHWKCCGSAPHHRHIRPYPAP